MLIVISSFIVFGCDTFKEESEGSGIEPVKDLKGSWKIVAVTRNGVDIYQIINFKDFRLNLNEDNSYTIDSYLPFLVKNNGSWNIDDPLYPNFLTFQESGSEAKTASFSYPIVEGKRRIILTLSPGCVNNIYVYSLERSVNP